MSQNREKAGGRAVLQRCHIYFFYFYMLIAFSARRAESAIRVSAPMEIWPPTITSNVFGSRSVPVVASTENGGLLVWLELSSGGVTNVMAAAISKDGQMLLQPFGRLIGIQGFSGFRPEIYPAGDEFYVMFRQALSRTFDPSVTMFTRVSADGRVLGPPVTIATNSQVVAWSNGQSLLTAWLNGNGATSLALFRSDGGVVRTNVLTAASTGTPLKLSSVGRMYLVIEQDRSARLEGIVVNGFTGAIYTNIIASAPGFAPMALSSDESQYLLATERTTLTNYSTQFYLLSGDGRILATGASTNVPQLHEPKMIPYGTGWVMWGYQNYGQIIGYSLTSNGDSVVVGPNPLPPITGQSIAPFGEGFLVGVQTFSAGTGYRVGYKKITASGESPVQFPLGLSRQSLTTVASSPDGYLALWHEQGNTTNVVGVRFLTDGTRLDTTPFIVVTNGGTGRIRALYETNAYHVIWVGNAVGRLIDPVGPPNVRAAPPIDSIYPDFEVTKFAGELVAYGRVTYGTSPYTSIWRGSQFTLKPGVITLAGADDRVFHASLLNRQLWTGVAPDPFNAPVKTNMIGVSMTPAAAASLGTNFFVGWHDSLRSNIVAAIAMEGVAPKTNVLFKNVSTLVSLTAASSDDSALLSVTLTNNVGSTPTTNLLALYNKIDGTYSVASQIMPIVANTLSIANLESDFVIATSLMGEAGPVAALQFVTAALAASATISIEGGGLMIKFADLEPTRSYRIERSTDLATWEPVRTVSQADSFTLPVDGALAAAFYRAVLAIQ